MPSVPAPNDQWYVVHVLSGHEQKVRKSLLLRRDREELGDLIFDVLMPTERVSEVKKGKKSESTRKFYPGYLIVNMHLLDGDGRLVERAWYFIQETDGVIGFAGAKARGGKAVKPVPMAKREVESMLAQIEEREEKVKPKIDFEVGESVKVADGPFEGQVGIVEEVHPDRGEVLVSVSIFGRSTPVPLEYWQVEKG
jgi:transcription termination/antitermination protein NusG